MSRLVRIGLLGGGVVGRGLVQLVSRNGPLIAERTGLRLEVARVLVRDPGRAREGIARSLLTTKAEEIVHGPVDVVVEALGGLEPARSLVLQALEERKPVVTANKALLADTGCDIAGAASRQGVALGFEATVAGALPIVRVLEQGLAGDRISEITAILNGTSNFILTRLGEEGESLEAALRKAQELGFAEADPALDLDGHDAGHKLSILAGLAFSARAAPTVVEGIRDLDPLDADAAGRLGYVLKPVAWARDLGSALELRVHPAFLPRAHPLASVRAEDNGVLVRSDAAGELLIRGKGAGALPTASALVSDIVAVVSHGQSVSRRPLELRPVAREGRARRYLRFPVHDAPGVIGRIATVLGQHEISISHAEASLAGEKRGHVRVLADETDDSVMECALESIGRLPVLTGKPVAVRILG